MRIALYEHVIHNIGLAPLNVDEYDCLPMYRRVSEIIEVDFKILGEDRIDIILKAKEAADQLIKEKSL